MYRFMTSLIENEKLSRSLFLLGQDVMQKISVKKIILFGVGGVGSWCAESLIRSGIQYLTIVDFDTVCLSNCNRQLEATSKTIGQAKVEVLKTRLLEINPQAEINALQLAYSEKNMSFFNLDHYDYIIDAIDSVKDKVSLILYGTSFSSTKLFSSMGAALRKDPFKIRKAEFWKIKGDALARAIRNNFKKNKTFPKSKFYCVYSEETPMENQYNNNSIEKNTNRQANGSLNHVTAIFGFALAGMVVNDIAENS